MDSARGKGGEKNLRKVRALKGEKKRDKVGQSGIQRRGNFCYVEKSGKLRCSFKVPSRKRELLYTESRV